MNQNEPEGHEPEAASPAPVSAEATSAGAPEGGGDAAPNEAAAASTAPDTAGGGASDAGAAAGGEGGPPADGQRRKKRRRGRGRGEGGPPHPGAPHAGPQREGPPRDGPSREGPPARSYVEDRLDKDAEQLARDARSLPFSRLRPLGILAQEVRRMVATGDARDAREARRALVLLKSRVAYLAGREQGKERSALVKVREFVFRGVDHVTRNADAPDPQQLRNFLDGIEALVAYHRFHADDRRRD